MPRFSAVFIVALLLSSPVLIAGPQYPAGRSARQKPGHEQRGEPRAVLPVENHAFTEEMSWADEYRRILKLFEENLRPKVGKRTN